MNEFDTRHESYPHSSYDECSGHIWREKTDSQFSSEYYADVTCEICGCPGEQNRITGGVFWPAT